MGKAYPILHQFMTRKLIFILTTSFLMLSNRIEAQEGFHFGIKFQPQLSQIKNQSFDDSTEVDLQSTLNWGAGISLSYFIVKDFAIQLEAIYAGQGQKYTGLDTFGITAYYQRVDYLNIPLLFKLTTGDEKFLGVNVHAGPQVGLMIDSRLEATPTSGSSIETNTKSSTNAIDFGITYGAGLDFNIAKRFQFNLGIRLYNGIVDINDSADKSAPGYTKSLNRTQSAIIGFTF